jgi:universal stress protein E
MNVNNLLVIVDPTATTHPAVDKAALLARKLNARLELYVCDTRAARESRMSSADGVVDVRALLQTMAQPLREQGIDVTVEAEFGDPLVEKLVQRTCDTSADLVVKDTHHHSLARRTFLTNTDWELIRACPAALLLTKSARWAQTPKIVAALDPGHANDKPALLDQRILEQGRYLAQRLGGELHALHAYIPVSIIAAAVGREPPTALAVSPQDLKLEQEQKTREVEELAGRFDIDRSRIHVQLGGPAQVLPQAARDLQADVMVMGALSRRGLKRAFIGSTAEDVLEQLGCDALIVKPADFSAALQALCP